MHEAEEPGETADAEPPPFEEFYRRERDRLVRALALRTGNLDVATEAVDVAMARAWQRWARLNRRAEVAGWVYRVAANWATSWFRRHRWITDGEPPDEAVEPVAVEPHPELAAAVDRLSDRLRDVVLLRLYADLSVAETATALRVPQGTVKSRLARALHQLRNDLEGSP